MDEEISRIHIHKIHSLLNNNKYQYCSDYIIANNLDLNIIIESLSQLRHYHLDNSDYSFFLKQLLKKSKNYDSYLLSLNNYISFLLDHNYFQLARSIYWNANLTTDDHIRTLRTLLSSMKHDIDEGYSIDWSDKQAFFEGILQNSKISFIYFLSKIHHLYIFANINIWNIDPIFIEKMLISYSSYQDLSILPDDFRTKLLQNMSSAKLFLWQQNSLSDS